MKDVLRIGMQLLADLDTVRTKLVPCFPPHYNILQFFVNQYAIVANSNVSEVMWREIERKRIVEEM